jgi:hypothetical protein
MIKISAKYYVDKNIQQIMIDCLQLYVWYQDRFCI